MKTNSLKTNQLSTGVYDWYLTYLEAIDSQDLKAYSNFLSEECVMYFNNDSYKGKSAILQNLSQYWQTFESVNHDLLNIYGNDSSFVLEALNHYQRKDGKNITVRAVAITDRNDNGLVTSFRLYSDTTPLFG